MAQHKQQAKTKNSPIVPRNAVEQKIDQTIEEMNKDKLTDHRKQAIVEAIRHIKQECERLESDQLLQLKFPQCRFRFEGSPARAVSYRFYDDPEKVIKL